jgi:hypothetical protein
LCRLHKILFVVSSRKKKPNSKIFHYCNTSLLYNKMYDLIDMYLDEGL